MVGRQGHLETDRYQLGADVREQQRLRFQDQLWEAETEQLLDQLRLDEGNRVLELGCGVGLSLPRLARRVGETGSVVAIESNAVYALQCRDLIREERLSNVQIIDGNVLDHPLPQGSFDAVYARWVCSFLPPAELAGMLRRVHAAMAPGGVIGLIDYNHDGMRMFPRGDAFADVVEAFRAWYRQAGGDLWVAGALPGALHASGYHCDSITPQMKAGAPGSDVWRWIGEFVHDHGPRLVEQKLLSDQQWEAFTAEWQSNRIDPATVVFSPIVVGIVATRV